MIGRFQLVISRVFYNSHFSRSVRIYVKVDLIIATEESINEYNELGCASVCFFSLTIKCNQLGETKSPSIDFQCIPAIVQYKEPSKYLQWDLNEIQRCNEKVLSKRHHTPTTPFQIKAEWEEDMSPDFNCHHYLPEIVYFIPGNTLIPLPTLYDATTQLGKL